jgi:glutathione S-transferase
MAETDTVLQSGLRALELANRVLTINGPSWVADRALTAAEIAMAAAVQRLSHMNGMAQQLRTVAAAAQQTRAESAALTGGAGVAADDDSEDELKDTCCSILRELGEGAAA